MRDDTQGADPRIPPPERPTEPVYEDAQALPDKAHEWRLDEDGEIDICVVDNGYHNGPGCQHCSYAVCQHCHVPDADLSCLRQQAEDRNRRLKYAHEKAVARYEAQMDYWRSLVGQA